MGILLKQQHRFIFTHMSIYKLLSPSIIVLVSSVEQVELDYLRRSLALEKIDAPFLSCIYLPCHFISGINKNQVNTFTGFLKTLTFCSYGNVFNGLHIHILAHNNTEPDILFTTIINIIFKIVWKQFLEYNHPFMMFLWGRIRLKITHVIWIQI